MIDDHDDMYSMKAESFSHTQALWGKWEFDEMVVIEGRKRHVIDKDTALDQLGDDVFETYFEFREDGTAKWTIIPISNDVQNFVIFDYELGNNTITLYAPDESIINAEIVDDTMVIDMSEELDTPNAFWVFQKVYE